MLLNYQQKQSALNESDQISENIFIIHGLFGSLTNLTSLAKQLQLTHDVTLIDLRNHGASPHSANHDYQNMADDIFELADSLNIECFSIVGHSMGGKVAMACALSQPQRINKLVIADIAPVNYPDKHSDVFKGLKLVAQSHFDNRKQADQILSLHVDPPEVRQFLLKSLIKVDDQWQFQFNLDALENNYAAIRAWPEFEQTFNKEVLFIKGANSDYITAQSRDKIRTLFPLAKAKIITDTGHWLHAEKPQLFNRLVSQFFKL